MKSEPEIIKELREAEKFGRLQSNEQGAYDELETTKESSEDVPKETTRFVKDGEEGKEVEDDTTYERPKETLSEIEERYRDLLENVNDMIQAVGPDGSFLYVNRAWKEKLGYGNKEIKNLSIFDIIHPNSKKHCMEIFKRIMSGENIDSIEATFVTKDGKEVIVEGNVNCRFKDGKPVSTRGIFRDVTKHKKAEEAVTVEAVHRRILMEQSRDGIVVLDQDGSVYESNQRFAEMLGFSPEEVSHLHVWDWDFQFTREQLRDMLRNVDETGDNFETQHRRKDGTIYDVEISTNGAVFGGEKLIFCVCRDITERKKANEVLQCANEKLERKVDELEQYKRVTVGRELKMVELKNRIRELEGGVKNE